MSGGNQRHIGVNDAHAQQWERARLRLRAELGDTIYNSWFGQLQLARTDEGGVFLTVPTKFLKSWIESHYADRIKAHLSAEFSGVDHVFIEVRSPSRRTKSQESIADRNSVVPTDRNVERFTAPLSSSSAIGNFGAEAAHSIKIAKSTPSCHEEFLGGSPLDPRFSFSTFLVGPSNQLAYAAACRVASAEPGIHPLFNPLYTHAAVGRGKTHLLQAMARAADDDMRQVIYLSAEKFMSGFVSSLIAQTSIAFKEKLRAIDVLIIDDVQFLQGKSIQQEFCHTLNALIDAGKQVVVAADRPPSELETLDERVLSRFKGGLCVDIGPLDQALRVKILEARIVAAQEMQPSLHVPPAVIAYMADTIVTNGRDLEGAVNRLLAHVTLSGAPLTVETAEIAIRDLVRTQEPKRVKIDDIQKLVASHYNVSRSDILSARRTASVVRPRQIAMYLSKVLTFRSLPEIGRRFGGRDHTTVLHAVRRVEELAAKDPRLSEDIDLLKRILGE